MIKKKPQAGSQGDISDLGNLISGLEWQEPD